MKRSHSDEKVNWDLCFVCQNHIKDKKFRPAPSGINTLSQKLLEFYRLGGLKFEFSRISSTFIDGVPNIQLKKASSIRGIFHISMFSHVC